MRSAERTKVLVTGAGTGRANNLIRSLKATPQTYDVLGCHDDPFMLSKSEGSKNYLSPSVSDPSFIDATNRIIESQKIDIIIPSSDDETLSIARIARSLSCKVMLPNVEEIEHCQDKYRLSKTLRANKLAAPETYLTQSRQDVINAFQKFGHPPLLWCRTRSGVGSRGATKVKDAEQTWAWIAYWHEMRGVGLEEFTLSEYLPGRDYNVQGLWKNGKVLLIKMCERLSYLDGANRPSGTSSTPALAKTIAIRDVLELCELAILAVAPRATGVFNFDLKEDGSGQAMITEINAGRFAMITNIYDFTGKHNMAQYFVKLALGQPLDISNVYDIIDDYYLIRDYDTLPLIISSDELQVSYDS